MMQRVAWILGFLLTFAVVGCKEKLSQAKNHGKKSIFVDLNAKQAQALLKKQKGVVILDVRTPGEFAAGHIKGARNLNLYSKTFLASLKALKRTDTYLVHCAVGSRSRQAVMLMKRLGFTRIYHMADGFVGWRRAGLPVVR